MLRNLDMSMSWVEYISSATKASQEKTTDVEEDISIGLSDEEPTFITNTNPEDKELS